MVLLKKLSLYRRLASFGSAFGLPGAVRFSFGGMTAEAIARLDANLTAFRAEQ